MNFQAKAVTGTMPEIIAETPLGDGVAGSLVDGAQGRAGSNCRHRPTLGFEDHGMNFKQAFRHLPQGQGNGLIRMVAVITAAKIDGDQLPFRQTLIRSDAMRQGSTYSGSDDNVESLLLGAALFEGELQGQGYLTLGDPRDGSGGRTSAKHSALRAAAASMQAISSASLTARRALIAPVTGTHC